MPTGSRVINHLLASSHNPRPGSQPLLGPPRTSPEAPVSLTGASLHSRRIALVYDRLPLAPSYWIGRVELPAHVLENNCSSGRHSAIAREHEDGEVALLRLWRKAIALTFVLAILRELASPAMGQSLALLRKATEANEIVAVAQRQGYVRIIVQFESPVPASQVRPDPASIANMKARVAEVQDAIVQTHFGSAADPRPGQRFVRGLTRFELTPGFAVNVDLAELEALAADPRVKIINRDRAVPPLSRP